MDHIYIDIINDEPVNTLKSSQTKAPKDVPARAPSRSHDSHLTTRRTVLIFAIFVVVGFLVGSLISGLAVYFSLEDNNTSICLWSSWTSWTDCSSTCYKGIQHRVKIQWDTDNECRHNEIFENKTCVMNQCEGYNLEFSMTYDSATLHLDRYISDDDTILSSHHTQETPNSPDGPYQFKQYEGAITDICTDRDTIIYYTVAYNYNITALLNNTWLILEVGLAERERVDSDYYVGGTTVNGWSFHLANCATFNKICLWAQHRSVIKLKTPISDNIVGTKVNGKLGVVIDRVRGEFTLIINNEVVYIFQNVTSDVQLCPVFGVYNPDWVKTKLQMINSYNFTNVILFR